MDTDSEAGAAMMMLTRLSEGEVWSDVPQAEWKSGAHHPEFSE